MGGPRFPFTENGWSIHMRLERFDSVESYAQQVADKMANYRDYYNNYGGRSQGAHWDNGVGFKEAIDLSVQGDPSLVGQYSDFVDKLIDEYQLGQDVRKAYVSSVAGSRVQ